MDSLQRFFLDVCEQVTRDPDVLPEVPVELSAPGSEERRLLEAFGEMLTSLHRSRQALRARYEDLVNSIDGIVWEADARTVAFSFVSRQAERLLGYPISRWVTEPTFWQDHIHPEDRVWVLPFCAAATAEKRPHEFEYRMIAADGRVVWVRDIVSVIVAADQPVRLRGVMVDVTERKQAEAALEEREGQYRSIFDAATDGLLIRDMEGVIVEVNPAYCRMHGYTRDELIGRRVADLIHPDYRHVLRESPAAIQAGEPYHTEGVNLRKDGSQFPVEVHGTAFTYKGQPHVLAVVRDSTERKQAQQELQEKEEQYRSVFESTSDGLFINTLEGKLVDFNPAAARMHGYTEEEFRALQPTDFIHPDSLPLFRDYIEAVRAGRPYRCRAIDRRKDGSLFHVEVIGHRFSYGGQPHTLAVVRDVTEEVEAYQLLERRVEERTRELTTLLQISQNVASTLELNPLLDLILDQLGAIVEYDGASLSILEGDELIPLAYRGSLPQAEVLGMRRPARRSELVWQRLEAHDYFLVGDIRGDTPQARDFRQYFAEIMHTSFKDRSSALLVPLLVREEVIGYLGVAHNRRDYYSDHDASLVMAIASQAAAAIENARLYEQAQEEARKTAALAHIASSVALGGALDEALDDVARNVVEACGAVACVMMIAEGDRMRISGAHGTPEGYAAAMEAVIRTGPPLITTSQYYEPGPLVLHDLRRGILAEPALAPLHPFVRDVAWDTAVSLPLVYNERHLGRLNLYYVPEQEPGEKELAFLAAIASQAATAVENARLYEQAQSLAALEERQRLARELHDSVSQALYGIALGTRTARTLLERNQNGVGEALEYIASLAAAGMAEMRALIFELRPESLESEGLVAALTKQAASIQARHRLDVVTELSVEPDLPLETKEVLYRIAQEALHNTVKHAQAHRVHLRLEQTPESVLLVIRDDGIGFDTGGSFPGHLGLKSMQERAARLGGTFTIESAPGQGTSIRVVVPAATGDR